MGLLETASAGSHGMYLVFDDTTPENEAIQHYVFRNDGYTTAAVSNTTANAYVPPNVFQIVGVAAAPDNGTAADRSAISVDGDPTPEKNNASTLSVTTSAPDHGLDVGNYAGSRLTGYLGDVLIHDVALTALEVAAIEAWLNARWAPGATAHTETPTDAVGITDSEATAKTVPVTVTDAVGITDSHNAAIVLEETITDAVGIVETAKAATQEITDAVGLLDSFTRVHDAVRTPTDTVGITDSATPAKTIQVTVTDAVGIVDSHVADDSTLVFLPSIDGALPPSGIQLVNIDPSATQDFYLPSIDGAAPPPGVNLYTDNEIAAIEAGAAVYAELWSAAGSKLADLTNMIAVDWQDVHNDIGVGTLTIPRDEADAALIVLGVEVRCYLYGQLVYTWVVDEPPPVELYDPDDEAVEVLVATGTGRVGRLNEALVYPPKGVDNPLAAAHRLYSFASLDFPNGATWHNAYETVKADQLNAYRQQPIEITTVLQGEPDITETIFVPPPLEWPDPDAYWIWGQLDTTVVGHNFFRRQFTLNQDSNIGFCVTGDNFYTLYLDGTPILGENVEERCWTEFKRVDMFLPAGTYQLAAVVENIPGAIGPGLNPAGFLCSVFTVTAADGEPDQFLVRSDSSWTVLNYPQVDPLLVYAGFAQWPGWTPGQILIDAIDEAQARGLLTGFTYTFTEWSDSAGNPWPFSEGFSVPIGSTLLDMVNSLVEQGWIDYRVAPGGLVLEAFNPGFGQTAAMTLQATGVEATTNVETYSIEPQSVPYTKLLVKWASGQFELDDAPAQAAHGIRELFITVDAATKLEAIRQAQVVLDNVKNPRDAYVVGLAPKVADDRPYSAYTLGDMISAPDRTEATNPEKLLAISVGHDEEGNPIIQLELQTRIERRERQEVELFKMLGRGVTGSTKIRQGLYETGGVAR
jgi:hypothetical protein